MKTRYFLLVKFSTFVVEIKTIIMKYPNRVIQKGESDKSIVKAIQSQLLKLNCGPIEIDGDFGSQTFSSVKLFQSRNTDIQGIPLVVDGKIGSITWQILFKETDVHQTDVASNDLFAEVIRIANTQLGVREDPPNSNRGKDVAKYLKSVGLDANSGHYSWCMAFVYWCFNEAYNKLGKPNPLVKTGGVLRQWNETKNKKIKKADAINNPSLIKPGFVFIRNHGGGKGHTGIVVSVNGGYIETIEGNSNNNGSREGVGVFRLTRKIASIENGFIDFKNT